MRVDREGSLERGLLTAGYPLFAYLPDTTLDTEGHDTPGESGTRTERDGPRAAGSRKRPTGPHYHKSGRWRSLTRVTDTGRTGMGRSPGLYPCYA
eukprot:scaffold51447_cov43-Attheya_sp.AAC.1